MSRIEEPLTDEQAEQMERGLKRLLHTPPKPHGKNPDTPREDKKLPAPKGRQQRRKPSS